MKIRKIHVIMILIETLKAEKNNLVLDPNPNLFYCLKSINLFTVCHKVLPSFREGPMCACECVCVYVYGCNCEHVCVERQRQ